MTGPEPVLVQRRDRRYARGALLLAAGAALFVCYLQLTRSLPVNADGSSNVLQAADMLHGNLLLRGWTVSDVSFWSTELIEYALVELFVGLGPWTIWVASALTHTLLVLLVGLVACGRATGWRAVARVGVAVAIVLVPLPVSGYLVVLSSPDHTGTAVPLLGIWLLLDRAPISARWLPFAIGGLLVWAQLGDPLAMFVGAVPLAGVSVIRMLRGNRRVELRLLLATAGSMAMTQLVLLGVHVSGGFGVHAPIAEFSPSERWLPHLRRMIEALAVNAGAYRPEMQDRLAVTVGTINAVGLALSLIAVLFGLFRLGQLVWPASAGSEPARGDRVCDVLTVAVVVNLAAYVTSTQADGDLGSSRQIVITLPYGAVLAGRLLGDRLAAMKLVGAADRLLRWPARAALLTALAVLAGALVMYAERAVPSEAEGTATARWLDAHDLTDGVGAYWAANNITVATGGRVRVAPVTGRERIHAYRWESRADWYNPAVRDARFLILDRARPDNGTEEVAREQFGDPTERHDFGQFTVLLYPYNLLRNLPAYCGPSTAESMAKCPPLIPEPPGMAALR